MSANRYVAWSAGRLAGFHGEDVRRSHSRIQPHVIRLAPPELLTGQLVRHDEVLARTDAERRKVEPDGGLPGMVRVDIYHDQNRVAFAAPTLR